MAVAVKPNLVPRVADHGAFVGKGLERVPGDVPGRVDVVLGEELEEAAHADGAGEEAARYVGGRVLAAVAAQPAGDGVDVDGDAAEGFWRYVRLSGLNWICMDIDFTFRRHRIILVFEIGGDGIWLEEREIRWPCEV